MRSTTKSLLYCRLLLSSAVLSRNSFTRTFAMSVPKKAKTEPKAAALFEGDELWEKDWKEADGEATLKKRMNASDDGYEFVLYGSWFCPFAQRAWIAAEHSGVSYLWKEINPYYVDEKQPGGYTKKAMTLDEKKEKYPDCVEASPRGLVPAVRVTFKDQEEDLLLWESLPVSEFIDAVFGGNLMPRNNPFKVAQQQIWCDHCTSRIQKKYYQALVADDKKVEENCVQEFYEECRALANAMSKEGPFFDGEKLTMVDVALAPFWQRIITVGPHYFGLKLPEEEEAFQRLDKWWKACKEHSSIKATIVCEPRMVSTYSDYSKNEATSDAARNYFK